MNNIFSFPWQILVDFYQNSHRKYLPWRDYENYNSRELGYRVWLAEILLQQTQAERVADFYTRIIKKFENIESLANADYDEFFPYYQGLGYYSRARNLLKTARIISEKYSWEFPKDKKTLKNLPGIGEYTSSAILCFAFWETTLAWDTNLEKVFSRYFLGTSQIKLSNEQKHFIEKNFQNFIQSLPKNSQKTAVRTINNALMDFARIYDLKNPENIDWEKYPLQSGKFFETRGKLENHEIKKQENFPIPDAKVVVILHENHKLYFWKNDEYSPFILNPSEDRDTRNFVKKFFKNNYNLEVSVRPIHKKWLSKNDEPFIAVNAQIQTGKHNFKVFDKKIAKKFLENLYKN